MKRELESDEMAGGVIWNGGGNQMKWRVEEM